MRIIKLIAMTLLVVCLSSTARADNLRLPSMIADHMVLQSGEQVRIWGWGTRGAKVHVNFGDQTKLATVGASNAWDVTLDAMPASSESRSLTVRSNGERITVDDVLVGEVWLCSGQSNMVWTVNNSQRADEFKSSATDSRIRMFTVPNVAEHEPQENCPGQWSVASPETVGRFSAVGYQFGRNLADRLDVPIGLVNSSWGGSTVEAWVSRPTLDRIEAAQPFLDAYDELHDVMKMDVSTYTGPTVDQANWKTAPLPGLIEEMGYEIDGLIWFRRTVDLPAAWAGRELTLTLGAIDDNDITYFNGTRIGGINNWQRKRAYTVPANLTTSRTAVIAVRVEDTGGAGGFSGSPAEMSLYPTGAQEEAITMSGDWRVRIMSKKPSGAVQHRPANLYNAKIHPLRHYTMRGAIWYQGESNAIRPRGEEYFTIFPALIHNWRAVFGNDEFPFYYVQLPNFTNNEPNTIWRYPTVRQAQLETMRAVPNTGMAVTLELGEANDIHPRNKHDVGERLARWALVDTYGIAGLVKSGPIFESARFDDDNMVYLTFDLYGSTLAIKGTSVALQGFELAGADGVFVQADARIDGDTIVVSSPEVTFPNCVRYAWKNNAVNANLANAEGWPASPFRSCR